MTGCNSSEGELTSIKGISCCPKRELKVKKATAMLRSAFFTNVFVIEIIYFPNTMANTNGATMVASDSMINLGVSMPSLPQVIFSLGTAPE